MRAWVLREVIEHLGILGFTFDIVIMFVSQRRSRFRDALGWEGWKYAPLRDFVWGWEVGGGGWLFQRGFSSNLHLLLNRRIAEVIWRETF